MTTTIEQLQKEARTIAADSVYRSDYRWLDELVAYIHDSAIRSAIESLEPVDGAGVNFEENNYEAGRAHYLAETEKKLQSLLVNE